MAIGMAGFTINDAITKTVSSGMNIGQVMLVRGLFATLLIGAIAWHQDSMRPLRTLALKPVLLRVAAEALGTVIFLVAIVNLPLANVAAIFQALPLVVTLGTSVIFGEFVGWRRWLAITAGFIGVLIVVRPGVEGFNQFSLVGLIAVAFYSVRDLSTRQIPMQIPSLFVTLMTTITVTVIGAIIVYPLGGWSPPSGSAVGLLALSAVLVLIGYQYVINGAAIRRSVRCSAFPLHGAAVGYPAGISLLRRRARHPHGDRRIGHRAVRAVRVLSRKHARHRTSGRRQSACRPTNCDPIKPACRRRASMPSVRHRPGSPVR